MAYLPGVHFDRIVYVVYDLKLGHPHAAYTDRDEAFNYREAHPDCARLGVLDVPLDWKN